MASERTAEIWSTRLQRELVALTTSRDGGAETNASPAKENDIGLLPPFVAVKEHTLEIEKGICTVSFSVTVEGAPIDDNAKAQSGVESAPGDDTDTVDDKKTDAGGVDENGVAAIGGDKDVAAETEAKPTEETTATKETTRTVNVIIKLDASLNLVSGSSPDPSQSYPFQKPTATITSGACYLPAGCSIKDFDPIDIDCDWTPSLHLNDAALNIALKVRESIKRQEPFHATSSFSNSTITSTLSDSMNISSAKVSSFFNSLRTRASAVAEELDQAVGSNPKSNTRVKRRKKKAPIPTDATKEQKKQSSKTVEIGDVIDLSQEPWNECVGMYSCKALKRPEFVQAAIAIAAEEEDQRKKVRIAILDDEDENEIPSGPGNYMKLQSGGIRKVAGAGLVGAGSMFKSFTQSAKSLVEESFIMLSEDLVIEIKCNKFSMASATVTLAIPVSFLSKLKFRRQESISLFFKQAPDDPLIYMCADSADAVKQIQSILKRHGVRGKHTNAVMQRAIHTAMQNISEIQIKEKALEEDASLEKVNEIMDLYRQAAEKFEFAGDARHEEVMTYMHNFLAKPLTVSILDGSYLQKKKREEIDGESSATVSKSSLPEGEVLVSAPDDVGDDYENDGKRRAEDDHEFERAMQAAEDMLKNAHADLKDLGIDDDLDVSMDDIPKKNSESSIRGEDGLDAVTELEDMLKDADKELAELMSS